MTEVKRYHVAEAGLVEGAALGRINVVLGADYDAAVEHIRELELLAGQEARSTALATDAGLRVVAERDDLAARLEQARDRKNSIVDLQQRLTAADDRVDKATSLIRRLVANFDTEINYHEDVEPNDLEHDQVLSEMREFLTPNQPAAQPQGEPVAWEVYWADNGEYYFTSRKRERAAKLIADPDFKIVPLYAGRPASVAVALPSREQLRDIIAQAIGGDAYDCVRAWAAWGVGTMSQDDFVPVVEQEERLYEIADACLDELARLNTPQ